ncbi:MAG: hypothetical protein EPN55_01250 [Gammaproteobacteria bacterium]|nr:MAG: hypothetical protein EPN55_01250 [Gammaproteobacteria bacterium]
MALHLKTKFRARGPKTIEQRASVVASNIWKVAQEATRHMEIEGYKIGSDRQVTAILTELIAFQIQIADRLVYGKISEDERGRFVNALGQNLARLVNDNLREFIGPGDYAGPFVAALNARLADYAEFEFTDEGPSYAVLRYLGDKVAEAMAGTDNKWVLEQVMDIEAPQAVKHLKRIVAQVLGIKA